MRVDWLAHLDIYCSEHDVKKLSFVYALKNTQIKISGLP
jgi:hypothetical protein